MESNKYASIIMTHFPATEARVDMMKETVNGMERSGYPYELIVTVNADKKNKLFWESHEFLTKKYQDGKISHLTFNNGNFHFSFARNQMFYAAQGHYVCICDDDLLFKENWLKDCVECIEKLSYSGKIIATPLIIKSQDKARYNAGTIDGYRWTLRGGSNCLIMTQESFKEFGYFIPGWRSGGEYYNRFNAKGHKVLALPYNKAEHIGGLSSLSRNIVKFNIKKQLATGEQVILWSNL